MNLAQEPTPAGYAAELRARYRAVSARLEAGIAVGAFDAEAALCVFGWVEASVALQRRRAEAARAAAAGWAAAVERKYPELRKTVALRRSRALVEATLGHANAALTKDLAETLLAATGPRRVTVKIIARAVAADYGLGAADLASRRRTANYVEPRFVVCHLAKKLTLNSLPEIGRRLNRDHTSVLHGLRVAADRIARDPEYAERMARIEAAIVAETGG